MERRDALLLGAVAYDPKVVTIWDGFEEYFSFHGLMLDTILFTNYERQVEAQLRGHIHVAWNSPLAWLQSQRLAPVVGHEARALAMRDTDRDLTSLIVVRADSPIQTVEDLRGKRVAVGAADSPQATLIPLLALAERGLEPPAGIHVERHDVLVGKHGDHIGGERDAARALLAGRADAACMIDANHLLFTKEGILPPGSTRVLMQTPPYDHCNFTILDEQAGPDRGKALARFREFLLAMSADDPSVARPMELEGVTQWLPGRTEGYAQLERAVTRFQSLEPWMSSVRRILA
jgi:phosphonate transport system substrate-binding protein